MSDTPYQAYHVEAYIDQCDECGWNAKRIAMQWDSLYTVKDKTLENIFMTCEGSVADRLDEFKNWYLLVGQYLEDPDRIPF